MRYLALFGVCLTAIGQQVPASPPIQDLNVLIGKQVIVQRTILCPPGTFKWTLDYASKRATVVSLKPQPQIPFRPAVLNKLPPETRALLEDQRRAATILVQFEDGTQLDSCMAVSPAKLSDHFELVPGQTLDIGLAPDPTPILASDTLPAALTSSVTAAALTPSITAAPVLSKQECPVTVVRATSTNGGFGHAMVDGLTKSPFERAMEKANNGGKDPHYLDVRMHNATQKSIRAVEATVAYANLMGDQGVTNTLLFQNDNPIKAGKEFRGYSVDTSEQSANGKGDVTVYIDRVRFEDNTFWRDNGSRSCALTSKIKQ
jgi:hypothetical protein